MTNLIVDVSNIAWATRFSEFKGQNQSEFSVDLLRHSIIESFISLAIKFEAEGILLAFDGRKTWRKAEYPEYKATREKDLYYEEVIDTIESIRTFFSLSTNVTTVSVDEAEADDVIRTAAILSPKSIIISSDKDFIQLIDAKTRLYASTLKLERTTENRDFELFLKCIRGDAGDNIKSAYPKVREKKLLEAWGDPVKLANILETVLPDGRKVADCYAFNRRLIDLANCPQHVQDMISNEISTECAKHRYSQVGVMAQLGAMGLKKLAKDIGQSQGFYQKRFKLQ